MENIMSKNLLQYFIDKNSKSNIMNYMLITALPVLSILQSLILTTTFAMGLYTFQRWENSFIERRQVIAQGHKTRKQSTWDLSSE